STSEARRLDHESPPFFRLWKLVVASAYQFATIWALCFPAWPIFPSIESLNSRPPLGLSATNRRNPATPSTAPIVRRLHWSIISAARELVVQGRSDLAVQPLDAIRLNGL